MSGAQDMPTKMDMLVRTAAEALWESETDSMEDGWDTSLRGDKLCIDGEFQLRPVVRAVLRELREPSDEMCWRGSIALQDWYEGKLDGPNATSEACWQHMIDYILNEGK